MSPSIRELADSYLEQLVVLDPVLATELGIGDNPAELPDYSPEGIAAIGELNRATLQKSTSIAATPEDAVGKELMIERLGSQVAIFDAGEWMMDVNVIHSPQHEVKQAIDLMPRDTNADWQRIIERLHRVPRALLGYQQSLVYGLQEERVASQRQAHQAARLARQTGAPGGPSYFEELHNAYQLGDDKIASALKDASDEASAAYLGLANFFEQQYLPKAQPTDGVGADRWGLYCQLFNGAPFDPHEAYAWGIEELRRIRDEMAHEADKILPGAGIAATIAYLEQEPSLVIEGADAFQLWNQQVLDGSVAVLNGVHFDIPAPIQRVEAMLAPPGGAAAMYYTPPSMDLTRPGRTWYPTQGRTVFPLWHELSTVYHEGVPGHHLQLGYTTWLGEQLNAFQRSLGMISGHVEGWALYAERLMDELGFFEEAAYRLGMLSSQAFRAARVIIDIGLHHGFSIPRGIIEEAPLRWTRESSVDFLQTIAGIDHGFAVSEIDRYLGWPAQATSYKLGERAWLSIRDQVRRRDGAAFNLKRFHHQALELGLVGLDQLAKAFSVTLT